jgi:hypothetical protein
LGTSIAKELALHNWNFQYRQNSGSGDGRHYGFVINAELLHIAPGQLTNPEKTIYL